MYLKASINVDSFALVKILKSDKTNLAGSAIQEEKVGKNKSLMLQGVSDNYITFKYINKLQEVQQSFGINIKKYLGAQMHNITNLQQSTGERDYLKYTDIEKL